MFICSTCPHQPFHFTAMKSNACSDFIRFHGHLAIPSLEGLGQELRAAFLDVDGETQRELKFKEQRQKRSEDWRDQRNAWEDLG